MDNYEKKFYDAQNNPAGKKILVAEFGNLIDFVQRKWGGIPDDNFGLLRTNSGYKEWLQISIYYNNSTYYYIISFYVDHQTMGRHNFRTAHIGVDANTKKYYFQNQMHMNNYRSRGRPVYSRNKNNIENAFLEYISENL